MLKMRVGQSTGQSGGALIFANDNNAGEAMARILVNPVILLSSYRLITK